MDFDLLGFTCVYDVCENHLNIRIDDYWDGCLEEESCWIEYDKAKAVACQITKVVADACFGQGYPSEWREFYNCRKSHSLSFNLKALTMTLNAKILTIFYSS